MMKKILISIFAFLLLLWGVLTTTSSNYDERSSSPSELVHEIVKSANEDFKIQDTPMNKVNGKESAIGQNGNFKITGTLEWLRKNIQPYLQWIVFISLSGAVILLIWNGFKLVTNSSGFMSGGDIKAVKENITNILIGVGIMMSFVAIITVVNGLLNYFFGV